MTFDSPSSVSPYPAGYIHDLSLITEMQGDSECESTPLPDMALPPGHPQITGWAKVTDALHGAPMFLSTARRATDVHAAATGDVVHPDQQRVNLEAQQVVQAAGTQYFWDKATKTQSIALLWRTIPNLSEIVEQGDVSMEWRNATPSSIKGMSGAILCLGRPTDKEVKVLAFQNFQLGNHLSHRHLFNVKGGFLLPSYIVDRCTIDISNADQDEQGGTKEGE
ncbi:hypothetical protein SCUCBS95973_006032 [Sporothrix curviconia]|uniref:Uncharacterized protein n=1 Tax=Sporothrix curviconia TaxID=1260050 RepID=A0ABP0C1U1_9PEZI